jgi:lysozyme family protein
MTDLAKLKAANQARWKACLVNPGLIHIIDGVSGRLIRAKERYITVALKTTVPWPVIAVIHERESSQNWLASLAQGDPFDRPSVHVPKGRGPFLSWEEAAMDALAVCPPHAAHWTDWTIGGALTLLEQYNGLGYANGPFDHATGHRYPPQASPYIWASTNQYSHGKYVADNKFNQDAVDRQIGCAALLKRMTMIDPTIIKEWKP